MSKDVSGIDDLLPGLQSPLWEGDDAEFTAYAREAFGIPATMTHVSITPRGTAGRSAVAIDDTEGGLIFVLTPNVGRRQTHIRPIVAGPALYKNTAVVTRARANSTSMTRRAPSRAWHCVTYPSTS